MPIDINRLLVQTCNKINSGGRNEYGDYQFQAPGPPIACLYHDASAITQASMRETESFDGILWFGSAPVVALGDIYNLNGTHFQVVHITREERRLKDNSLQFQELAVKRTRQIS